MHPTNGRREPQGAAVARFGAPGGALDPGLRSIPGAESEHPRENCSHQSSSAVSRGRQGVPRATRESEALQPDQGAGPQVAPGISMTLEVPPNVPNNPWRPYQPLPFGPPLSNPSGRPLLEATPGTPYVATPMPYDCECYDSSEEQRVKSTRDVLVIHVGLVGVSGAANYARLTFKLELCWVPEEEERTERRARSDCEGFDCPEPRTVLGPWIPVPGSSTRRRRQYWFAPGGPPCPVFFSETFTVFGFVFGPSPQGDIAYGVADTDGLKARILAAIEGNAPGVPASERDYNFYIHSSVPASDRVRSNLRDIKRIFDGPHPTDKVDAKNPWERSSPPGRRK